MPEDLPRDGLVAVVKRDCPTCVMAAPVLGELAGLTVFTQDDPSVPETVLRRIDDTALDVSHRLGIEVVPTLIRFEAGREVGRTYGWDRREWERLTGISGLGRDLPEARPGCGAKNVEPGVLERLKIRFNETGLRSRRIAVGEAEDEHEAMFARSWSDGLPLVPPTEERVLRMLDGTARDPQEVLGLVPPALAAATVEKIAINAVMAGCKPEYLPVVLAAVEAVLDESFAMHGVLATTMFVGPVVVVNGPIRRRISMPRPERLDGPTIGILDIAKSRGDVFLQRLGDRLGERGIAVKRYAKPTNTRVAPLPLRQQIAAAVDLVMERLSD